MAKTPTDVAATKFARQELGKRGFDVGQCDVRVQHSTLHITGSIRTSPDAKFTDIKGELERVCQILRQKPGIKDVSLNVSYRT
jgi:hypothetical protein